MNMGTRLIPKMLEKRFKSDSSLMSSNSSRRYYTQSLLMTGKTKILTSLTRSQQSENVNTTNPFQASKSNPSQQKTQGASVELNSDKQ